MQSFLSYHDALEQSSVYSPSRANSPAALIPAHPPCGCAGSAAALRYLLFLQGKDSALYVLAGTIHMHARHHNTTRPHTHLPRQRALTPTEKSATRPLLQMQTHSLPVASYWRRRAAR